MSTTLDKILQPTNQEENNQEASHSKHLEMIFKEIYSTKDIEVKTDVNIKQVNVFSKAIEFGKTYQCALLTNIVNKQMQLLVSKGRGGRKEFTTISSNINNPNAEISNDSSNIFDRLLGKKV